VGEKPPEVEAVLDRIIPVLHDLAERMSDILATTPEGMRAKAAALMSFVIRNWDHTVSFTSHDELLGWSLARDLLGGDEPPPAGEGEEEEDDGEGEPPDAEDPACDTAAEDDPDDSAEATNRLFVHAAMRVMLDNAMLGAEAAALVRQAAACEGLAL